MGDENPVIIESPEIKGLMFVSTILDPHEVIKSLRTLNNEIKDETIAKSRQYIQFIKKAIPIQKVVDSELDVICSETMELVENSPLCKDLDKKFRILINKRKTSLETSDIINGIADKINHKVSLQDYDWYIRIEIIGERTGISVLEKDSVFRPEKMKKK